MIWRPRGLISPREPSMCLKERKAISGAHVKEGPADARPTDPILTSSST